jgi:hypothetical protein
MMIPLDVLLAEQEKATVAEEESENESFALTMIGVNTPIDEGCIVNFHTDPALFDNN